MLTKIFGYLIVFILLSIPVLIYRRWYPFRLLRFVSSSMGCVLSLIVSDRADRSIVRSPAVYRILSYPWAMVTLL